MRAQKTRSLSKSAVRSCGLKKGKVFGTLGGFLGLLIHLWISALQKQTLNRLFTCNQLWETYNNQ